MFWSYTYRNIILKWNQVFVLNGKPLSCCMNLFVIKLFIYIEKCNHYTNKHMKLYMYFSSRIYAQLVSWDCIVSTDLTRGRLFRLNDGTGNVK